MDEFANALGFFCLYFGGLGLALIIVGLLLIYGANRLYVGIKSIEGLREIRKAMAYYREHVKGGEE